MDTNLGQQILLAVGFLCVVPVLLVLLVAVAAFRSGNRLFMEFISPDVGQLDRRFEKLRAADPQAADDQLLRKIIHQQALRGGLVGAVTGLGGFITLPIALPVDVLLSLRIQAALAEFIAQKYGFVDNLLEAQVRTWLVMSGSARVSEATVGLLLRFLVRLFGKSLSKFIPVLGAGVSFTVNYLMVQAMGRAALRWYSSRAAKGLLQP